MMAESSSPPDATSVSSIATLVLREALSWLLFFSPSAAVTLAVTADSNVVLSVILSVAGSESATRTLQDRQDQTLTEQK